MQNDKTVLKVTVIMTGLVLITAALLYSLLTRPNPEALQAQAALSQAQAVEYQGEATLLQAKAQLVDAYPETLDAAGSAASELGRGLFLTALAISIIVVAFAIGIGYITRSMSNAYMEINAVKVLPIENTDDAGNLILWGARGIGDVANDGTSKSKRTDPFIVNLGNDSPTTNGSPNRDTRSYAERAKEKYLRTVRGIDPLSG